MSPTPIKEEETQETPDETPNTTEPPKTKKGEKLKSIMEAASALTTLGDSGEEDGSAASSPEKEDEDIDDKPKTVEISTASKRYIPEHKKPDAALTFPEKLMKMMMWADKQPKDFCVAWIADGKSFVIRDPDAFTRKVVPKYFKPTKFSSFTRKLYRWGFRQVNRGIGPDDPIIFGNEFFQRDNAELMAQMRSTTAASQRKMKNDNSVYPYPGMEQEQNSRYLLDRFYQEKAMGGMGGQGFGFPGMRPMNPMMMNMPNMQNNMQGMQNSQFMMQNHMPMGYGSQQSQQQQQKQPQSPGFNNNNNRFSMMPQQDVQQGGKAASDIVNAAINALRHAS